MIFRKLPVENLSEIYSNMHYRVIDVSRNEVIIPFDDSGNSTRLSSDSDGMYFMMSMKKFILRCRLFLSTFKKREYHESKGFIYELEDDKFKELPIEEQAKHVQKSWNRYMREK